jgi:hypothetical protein
MPIEVHCPNPVCARVHQVKNQYAGARGKCPACGSWMYVPASGAMPSEVGAQGVHLEQPPASPPVPAPATPMAPAVPARGFSVVTALLVLLGCAALGAVCAAPFLAEPRIEVSGDFAKQLPNRKLTGIQFEEAPYTVYVPAGIAAVALLSLLVALVQWRFGLISVFLLYLICLTLAPILFIAVNLWHEEQILIHRIEKAALEGKSQGREGDILITPGQQLLAATGGTVAAAGLFFLAVLTTHSRWWSRLLAFVVLGSLLALMPVWVYRQELALEDWLPEPFALIRTALDSVQPLIDWLKPWLGGRGS